MRTLKIIHEKLCNRYPKINPKSLEAIIKDYQRFQLETLVENGHIFITPDIKMEIIPITPRRYVLRGKEYKSMRLYKLKSTISTDEFYNTISEEYDRFREDL